MNDTKVGIIKKKVKNLIIFKNLKVFKQNFNIRINNLCIKIIVKKQFWEKNKLKFFSMCHKVLVFLQYNRLL